jgi:Fe2+ transport system protein FeoA
MAMKQDTTSAKKIIDLVDSLAKKIDCNSDCGYSSENGEFNESEENLVNLNFLSPAEHGTIVQVIGSGSLKKRLQEMGVMRGQKITVVKAAPLDDPIEVKIKNFHLSLRREEADMILVKKEN